MNPDFSKFLDTLPSVPPRVIVALEPGTMLSIGDALKGSDVTVHVGDWPRRYCLTVHIQKRLTNKTIRKMERGCSLIVETTTAAIHQDADGRPYTIYKGEVVI